MKFLADSTFYLVSLDITIYFVFSVILNINYIKNYNITPTHQKINFIGSDASIEWR